MAIVGYTLLGLLAAVVLLLCVPVTAEVRYRTGAEPTAVLRWLFWRFDLLEEKPEPSPGTKKRKPSHAAKKKTPKPPAARGPQGFSELLGLVCDLLASLKGGAGMLVRNFYIYRLRLTMVVAQDDAADTAIAYGRTNAAVYTTYGVAQNFLRMTRPVIDIRPDFTAASGTVDFELGGRLTPLVALVAAARSGVTFLLRTMKRKKQTGESTGEQTNQAGQTPAQEESKL